MTEKTHEKELDARKADIASLREEIAALATGVKKLAETKAAEPHAEGEDETDVPCGCGTPRLSLGLRTGSDFRGYCKMADLLNRNEMGTNNVAKELFI